MDSAWLGDDDIEDPVGAQPSQSKGAKLSWNEISIKTGNKKVDLLQHVSGEVKGRFLAVMGTSGSGKTTLVNYLAKRMSNAKKMGGQATLDDRKYTKKMLKKMSGYVMQDDLLFGHLTVRETLEYAAFLRLPRDMSRADKLQRVEEVINILSLKKCANTIVGNPLKKGISGGERKRLCVGIELLTRPRLLFLDEPTSGLDSVTALLLCQTLADLAHTECTVVCTIHQPQTKIFNLFDDLMLLSGGKVVYFGPANEVLDVYERAGFPCPAHTNPADHILDVITSQESTGGDEGARNNAEKIRSVGVPRVDEQMDIFEDKIQQYEKNKAEEQQQQQQQQQQKKTDEVDEVPPLPKRLSWLAQLPILLHRSFKQVLRSRLMFVAQLLQTIVMAVLIGTVFLDIGTRQDSVAKRQAVLFFVVINQGIYGALISIDLFPRERVVVLRERAAGTYHVSVYFIAKILAELPLQLLFPFIFAAIVYWLVGLQADAGKFFIFIAFLELTSLASISLALMVSAFARTTTLGVTILPVWLEICRLFGGFFLPPADLPGYFSWLDALSFVKYAFTALSLNEWDGLELTCSASELPASGICPITDGQQIIDQRGYDYLTIWQCALVLLAMIIGFRLFALAGIRFLKK